MKTETMNVNESKLTILKLLIVGLTEKESSCAKIKNAVCDIIREMNKRLGRECCKPDNIIVAPSDGDTMVQNILEKTLLAHEEQILLVISKKQRFGLKEFTSKKGIRGFLPRKSELVVTFYVRAIRRRRKAFFNAFAGSQLFSQGITLLLKVHDLFSEEQSSKLQISKAA